MGVSDLMLSHLVLNTWCPFLPENFPKQLLSLWNGARHVYALEEALSEGGLVARENQSLHALERNLLDMAGSNVTQGILLMIILSLDGSRVIRFFEAGSFQGFVHQKGRQVITKPIICL